MIQLVYRLDQRTIHALGKSFNPCPAELGFIHKKTLHADPDQLASEKASAQDSCSFLHGLKIHAYNCRLTG